MTRFRGAEGRDVSTVTRSEYCAVAIADCFADDGEIMGSPMGLLPTLGARLAKHTTNPLLMITDGEARILQGAPPLGVTQDVVEGWMPFRLVLESVVPYGKRHVMMGATQIDRHGNQNISAIGPWEQPKRQLLGVRGAPGNTVNNKTSYWVPKHSVARLRRAGRHRLRRRPGPGRGGRPGGHPLPRRAPRRQRPRRLRLRRTRPHDAVRLGAPRCHRRAGAGGLVLRDRMPKDDVPETREPSPGELMLIREMLDPRKLREREVPSGD